MAGYASLLEPNDHGVRPKIALTAGPVHCKHNGHEDAHRQDRQFARIRIPKTLLDEADLPEEVELHAQPGRLIVQAARHPRTGWAAAAKRTGARGDNRLLDESTSSKFDREDWEWR